VDVNWTTFFFEIVNFLVLVWIVWRFLYRPIRDVVERRRQDIDETIANATRMRESAEETRSRYETRLTDWEKEKADLRRAFDEELSRERATRLDRLGEELDEQRAKATLLEDRRLNDLTREAEAHGVAQGARFASKVLSEVATADVQARLIEMLLAEFPSMTPEQIQGIRAALREGRNRVSVTSAFEIDAAQRDGLEHALAERLGDELSFRYDRDEDLIAGVRISIGPIMWGASVKDELSYFVEAADGGT
jgi:F-type H+-transporting ATPase subunit b